VLNYYHSPAVNLHFQTGLTTIRKPFTSLGWPYPCFVLALWIAFKAHLLRVCFGKKLGFTEAGPKELRTSSYPDLNKSLLLRWGMLKGSRRALEGSQKVCRRVLVESQ